MTSKFTDKIAVITGGGTGIGRATALRLAEEGATVAVFGRRSQPLTDTVSQITSSGGKAQAFVVDVGDEQAFAKTLQSVEDCYGRLNILINNAFSYAGSSVEQTDTAQWRECFRVSLDAAFFGMRSAIPMIAKAGGGSIVNVSSVMALLSMPGSAPYSAAKAALIALSRSAALEGANRRVRVNTVVPGVVMTPSTEATLVDEQAVRATAASVPCGRIAEPLEIANPILFLAGDESSYITGTTLVVDGGKTCELNTGASSLSDFSAT